MRSSVRARSNKREQIIATSQQLFSRYGLHRVTVDQICQHAETSRVTFYKHFSNKEELVIELLSQHIAEGQAVFAALADSQLGFTEKVDRLIQHKITQTEKFTEGFLRELVQSPTPGIAAFMAEQMQQQQAKVEYFFSQAREQGDIRSDMSFELMWYLLEQLQRMFADPQLNQLLPDTEQRQRQIMQFFFYGITQHD